MKPVPNLSIYWWMSLAAMIIIFIVLLLDTRYNVATMLELEFAPTQGAFFATMIDNAYTKAFLEKCIYIDYAFIVAFTSLFCFSIIILRTNYGKKLSFYHRSLMLLPGVLDVCENTIMLLMVRHGGVSKLTYHLQMIIVYSKWVLVIPCTILAVRVLLLEANRIIVLFRKA